MWFSKETSVERLVERGLLTEGQAQKVLALAEEKGISISSALAELQYVKKAQPHYGPGGAELFVLRPELFPTETKNLLSLEEIKKFGALPLGFKNTFKFFRLRRTLNIGLLHPEDQKNRQALIEIAQQRVGNPLHGVRFFWVIQEQFEHVLDEVYGNKA